jgi:4-amino-4-deoxy-L-arabinose transferase-like glycosyltransferase/Flp pilus assembly protein TadD
MTPQTFLLFLLALIVRVVYLLQLKGTDPLFYHPIMDALYHHDWAVSIVKGGWLGEDAFFRAPLYPYFLSILYRIFGVNLLIPRIVQSLIGSFNCVLIQRIGRRLFSKKIGNIAGIIAALYPLFIYFDNELLIPALLLFFVLLGFYLILKQSLDKGTKLGWFVTGVVWGLAAITRPNVILFLIVLPFWLKGKLKKTFKPAVLYGVLGVVAVIMPVTVRNYIVSKEFVPIAWQGGTNFYIGNNPYSDGRTAIIPGTRSSWWGGFYDAKRIAEEAMGRELKNSEIDRYWLNQGLAFIKNEPGKAVLLFLKKTYLFFGGLEISNNRDIYFFTKLTYLKFLILNLPLFQFPFGLLFPLSLVGCWYAYKKKRDISLVLFFILSYSLSFIVFFVCARFRLAIIPFLIILASFAVTSVIDEIKRSRMENIVPVVLIFVISFTFFNANICRLKAVNPGFSYLTLADAEYKKGNYQKTISYSQEALNCMPDFPEALILLGVTYKTMGRSDKALSYYLKAIESDPGQPETYLNIGNIYADAAEYDKAKDYFLKAIEIDPYLARAYNSLGNVYFSQGDLEGALECYTKASKLEPNYVSPLYHAGLVHFRLGNIAEAESLWRRVIAIKPEDKQAQEALRSLLEKKNHR